MYTTQCIYNFKAETETQTVVPPLFTRQAEPHFSRVTALFVETHIPLR